MTRRFIICVDNADKQQQNSVTNFLKEKFGYWHWFSDVWLITDKNEAWTAQKLRNELRALVPGAYHLVLQINENGKTTWAAFGKTNSFDWLHKNWISDVDTN